MNSYPKSSPINHTLRVVGARARRVGQLRASVGSTDAPEEVSSRLDALVYDCHPRLLNGYYPGRQVDPDARVVDVRIARLHRHSTRAIPPNRTRSCVREMLRAALRTLRTFNAGSGFVVRWDRVASVIRRPKAPRNARPADWWAYRLDTTGGNATITSRPGTPDPDRVRPYLGGP